MQLFVLIMMMAVLMHDATAMGVAPKLNGGSMLAAALVPYGVLAACLWVTCYTARRVMDLRPAHAPGALRRADRLIRYCWLMVLAVFVGQIYLLGWLAWLQQVLGELPLLAELVVIAPPLGVVCAGWAWYYPLDCRMRQAALIRHLDTGQPLTFAPNRWAYIWHQFRHQVLLLLVPLLAILGWIQFVERWLLIAPERDMMRVGVTLAGCVVIFLTAPLMIRYIWDTVPLPDGPLRQRLLELCRTQRVRVRQLLLWRTYGGMINGAVMGLVAPVRYILLTDGLIERMNDTEIEAVMAHELGHIRRHHMPWMALCAIAVLAAVGVLIDRVLLWLPEQPVGEQAEIFAVQHLGLMGLLALVWIGVFGVISRRFERQADTFAVQHMARKYPDADLGDGVIGDVPVHLVCEALRRVAVLNHVPVERPSWRHGSIASRIDYLRTLVGRRIDRCPIDRQLARMRWSCATLLLVLAIYEALAV